MEIFAIWSGSIFLPQGKNLLLLIGVNLLQQKHDSSRRNEPQAYSGTFLILIWMFIHLQPHIRLREHLITHDSARNPTKKYCRHNHVRHLWAVSWMLKHSPWEIAYFSLRIHPHNLNSIYLNKLPCKLADYLVQLYTVGNALHWSVSDYLHLPEVTAELIVGPDVTEVVLLPLSIDTELVVTGVSTEICDKNSFISRKMTI